MSEPKPRTRRWTPNPDPTSIVVPGVDTTASINDQIDQIDQLIIIRLQNIDANFSRIQHLISTKLLPAFKRYAEGTEPVREAAKFWKSFYEAAAQVRIPITSEMSSLYQTEDDSADQSAANVSSQESNATPTNNKQPEDSFVLGAPISSTPLIRDPTTRDNEDYDSWSASIESPFERIGETQGGSMVPNSSPSRKSKSPLRQNVLRRNAALAAASDGTSTPPRSLHTPRRYNPLKNPFLPSNSSSRQWNGLVDLRQPSPARSLALRTPGPSTTNGYNSDSSDDLFPPGMSPPVTMQFAMGSRARASPVKLAPTPARKAAERIRRDLVASAVGKGTGTAKHSHSSIKPPGGGASRRGTGTAKHLHNPIKETGKPISSDSDSDSSEHDESNPSAGFLFATQNNARAQADDSFASSQQSMSSDENEDDAALAARHPLAHIFVGGAQGVEDSFDQEESFAPVEEDTVFGARLVSQGGEARPRLTLMRDALIDDTHPGAVSLNPHAQVEQSPTPYVRETEELG